MLLTTRNKKIYAHREYQSLIPLNVLEKHEGVALLKRQAGIDDDYDDLNTLATRIANECDGLPLAIVTTGRHLSGEKNIEMWEFVCEKLKKSKLEDLCHVNSEQRGVYASLKLSYDYLKTDEIKFCFLMCSLFPEDFTIPLEDLVRIGVGLDLYKGVSSIEEARRALRSMVETLKALGLLLDAYGKEFVRMHDIVRDVSLWITSKGENIFMSKIGMDLTQLTREKGWKQYTAISLLENKLKELSVRLNILPSIDQKGLKKLNTLEVSCCKDLKCMIDASQVGEENPKLHPSLAKLVLIELSELQCIWKGPIAIHIVNFQSLTDVSVGWCKSLAYLFTLSIARSLGQLKSLHVGYCESLEFLLKIEEDDNGRGEKMLSKLEDLRIEECERLEYVFPVFVAAGLVQLKELAIINSRELKQVFHGKEENEVAEEGKDIKLPNLKRLTLFNLVKLTRFFPDSTLPALEKIEMNECPNLTIKEGEPEEKLCVLGVGNFYQSAEKVLFGLRRDFLKNLEELQIENCEVRVVFHLEDLIIERQQHELSLPKLKRLFLLNLEELESLCKGPAHALRLKNLTTLSIGNCKKLKHIFSFTLAQKLGQLERLSVWDCENLEQVFYLDHERQEYEGGGDHKSIVLPKLKELYLNELAKLNLTSLTITHFNKLKHIFSPIVARNHMLPLKWLCIRECAELEQIIDVKDGEEVGANLLQTLSYIRVEKCHKLKNLFPISIARGFQQLIELEVRNNSELEQLFGDNDVIDEKEIQLPQLSIIYLEDLPRLTNFCHHFIFPAPPFDQLEVKQCPKIITRFSWDEDNKSVHAEAKAPKIGSQDDSHQETFIDLLWLRVAPNGFVKMSTFCTSLRRGSGSERERAGGKVVGGGRRGTEEAMDG
ncbi:hypothetical protein Patl1_33101 [Pistacia atlantica]|uniref:Uncharacterized protein n=1 Tax=Pistacia atlantica TaxID=434234 RepID=A0ACC1ANR3_9ROSI|nr:hypothetical protein Patl1_33101 [Pistacia atlantica]